MKKVFDNPPVRNELRDTVNVEVEYGFWPELDRRYRVITPQVCVMCSPDGQEVSRFFVNPVPTEDKFLEWLREAKASCFTLRDTPMFTCRKRNLAACLDALG